MIAALPTYAEFKSSISQHLPVWNPYGQLQQPQRGQRVVICSTCRFDRSSKWMQP
jgi:hypothetical protein